MLSLNEWMALLKSGEAPVEVQVIVTCCVVVVALLVMFIYEKWIRVRIEKIIWKSNNKWDDFIFSDKVMRALGYFIPFIIVYEALPYCLEQDTFVYIVARRVLSASLIVVVASVLGHVISGINDKIQASDTSNRPTSGIFQMIKIVVWCISVILIIATLIDKDPRTLLGGMTAFAAVLSLVFKDTIMGLVAGVQLAAYDMIHVGDWIILDKYGINGSVQEVTLNIVKVRNWDNSIATIPPHVLMTDSFQNYNNMFKSKARRIAVELAIDFNTVKLCSDALEQSLKDKGLYASSSEVQSDVEDERKVNLTLFSRYVEKYLSKQPYVNTDMFYMVRVRKPSPNGLPIEIYCYVNNVEWKHFEHTQSRVIEHVIAVLPEFGLKIFQSPSGQDITTLKS